MGLHLSETFENLINLLARNQKIMDLMNLPTVYNTDSPVVKNQKLNQAIKLCITKTSQNPATLGEKFDPITIDGKTYEDYGSIRITISTAQSTKLSNPEFGLQRVDIYVYYNNLTDSDKAIKILDLISNYLANKELQVVWEDDEDGSKHTIYRNLEPGFILTQTAIINNYERIGFRYFFYNTYYNN